MGVKVDLATDAELARVRPAYLGAGPYNPERLADDRVARQRDALVRLADAWGKMDIEARAAVSLALARMVSPDADPHDLDVGQAAYRAMIAGNEDRVIEPDLDATAFGTQLLAKRKRGSGNRVSVRPCKRPEGYGWTGTRHTLGTRGTSTAMTATTP